MKGKWIKKTLDECCNFYSGSGFPERFQGHNSGDYPFIKVSDMSLAGNSIFLTNANNWVSREIAAYLSAKIIPSGATAFAKIGAAMLLNRRRITVQDTCFDNNMMAAIPKETIDGRFIYYIFTTLDFADFSQVTALPSLNLTALKSYMICLPKIKEDQQHIAYILTSCDDVIEQTEKAIEKYKAIKAGMLQDLFTRGVDANGKLRPKPEDAPELYKDSPLGKIPNEWDDPKILGDNSIAILNPIAGSKKDYFIYIDLECVSDGKILFEKLISRKEAPSRAQRVVVDNDILFQLVRPYQKNNLLFNQCGNYQYVASTGYAQIRAFCDARYMFYYLHTDQFLGKVLSLCTGTGYPAITPQALSTILIPLPKENEQQEIAKRLVSVDSQIISEEQTLAKYRSIKQGLMKKLLTPPKGALEA